MAVDVATISVGLQSLKAAFEIGKALLNLGLSVQVQDRIREMNDRILSAQESAIASRDYQTALLKQMDNLEKQITDLEAWDAETETYQLSDIAQFGRTGQFAYAPKPDTHIGEPPHLLCANCFNQKHKSILQNEQRDFRTEVVLCQRCGHDLYLVGERPNALVHKRPTKR